MIFAYKAIGPSGQRLRGQIEALNAVDLEIRLKLMGLELIRAQPGRPGWRIRQRTIRKHSTPFSSI